MVYLADSASVDIQLWCETAQPKPFSFADRFPFDLWFDLISSNVCSGPDWDPESSWSLPSLFHQFPRCPTESKRDWRRMKEVDPFLCLCVIESAWSQVCLWSLSLTRHFIIFGISVQWCYADWQITLTNWSSFIQTNQPLCYSSPSDVDVWHRWEGMHHFCCQWHWPITNPADGLHKQAQTGIWAKNNPLCCAVCM